MYIIIIIILGIIILQTKLELEIKDLNIIFSEKNRQIQFNLILRIKIFREINNI